MKRGVRHKRGKEEIFFLSLEKISRSRARSSKDTTKISYKIHIIRIILLQLGSYGETKTQSFQFCLRAFNTYDQWLL